jgi:hypothetical protein
MGKNYTSEKKHLINQTKRSYFQNRFIPLEPNPDRLDHRHQSQDPIPDILDSP